MSFDLTPEVPEEALRELAGILFSGRTTEDILYAVAHLAQSHIAGCDAASVTLVSGGTPSTPAASDELAVTLDRYQYDSAEGPCLDAIREKQVLPVETFDDEECRWPIFARRAAGAGVRSALSLPLIAADDAVGALNLYSCRVRGFSGAEATAEVFARQAAVTLANATAFDRATQLAAHLEVALEHRDIIGQAKGILMSQTGVNADEAFDMLRRASQRTNTRLYDLACGLAERHANGDPLST